MYDVVLVFSWLGQKAKSIKQKAIGADNISECLNTHILSASIAFCFMPSALRVISTRFLPWRYLLCTSRCQAVIHILRKTRLHR